VDELPQTAPLASRAVSAVKWSALRTWGARVFALGALFVLARLLSPADFGLIALANVYIALLRPFVDQGFGDAVVQMENLDQSHLDTAFWTNVGFGATLCGLSWLTAGAIAGLYDEPRLADVIRWLSLVFLGYALSSTQQSLLRRRLEYRSLAIRTTAGAFVGGVVGIAMAAAGYGVWSLVGGSLATTFVSTALLWRLSEWRPRFHFSLPHLRPLIGFGGGIVGVNLLNFANRRSDDLIIGYFLGATALGYYSVAYQALRGVTNMVTSVVSSVAFPVFSRLQGEPERMRNAFYTVTQLVALFAFPTFVGLALVSEDLIIGFFGPQWAASAPVMRILAFVGIVHSVFYFHTSVILAMGRPGLRFTLTLISAVLNIIGFLISVRWGIAAVAAAYVLRAYLMSPLTVGVLKKLLGISYGRYLRSYWIPFSCTLLMAAGILGIRMLLGASLSPVFAVVFYAVTGIVLYGIAVTILGADIVRRTWALLSRSGGSRLSSALPGESV
jgi:O-antigen/teichoic acid export membrane protein